MSEQDKSIIKNSSSLTRYDPKARKELVVRGLNALAKIMDADYYFFKGEEHRINGELKQAIEYYEKALQINPEHEDSLFWMGYSYMPCVEERAGDDLEFENTIRNESAALAFQKLIDVRKKNNSIGWSSFVVYYNLGILQHDLGLIEKAFENFVHAIELNPDDADSYYWLGFAQYNLKLYEEAIESFKSAIELNPGDMDSRYMLDLLQGKIGAYYLASDKFWMRYPYTFLSLTVERT